MNLLIKIISCLNIEEGQDFFKLIRSVEKTPNSLPWHSSISQSESDSFLEKYTESNNSEVYFMYTDSILLSAGIISSINLIAQIELLCIHPNYHGQGLGPKMLELFETFASNKKAGKIVANLTSVERIEQFYLRNGFTRESKYYVKPINNSSIASQK